MSRNTLDGYYLFSSSAAALVARIVTHPVDTIKTRLQIINTTTKMPSIFNVAFPLTTLYRGLPVSMLFSVPALSVYLSCYEWSKQTLNTTYKLSRDTVMSHLLSACAAEVVAGALFTPMEVMKNRLQTQQKDSTITLAKTIAKTEGFRGFFRGYWMGMAVFVPHSMIYFVTYESMKQWMNQSHFQTYMLCSTVAGVTSIAVSTPLDTIKTRWQVSAADQGQHFRQGPIAIAKNMIKQEGRVALTRGLLARIACGIPSTTISMTIFEVLKDSREKILGNVGKTFAIQ
ncbi:mitochondrial carrier [Rhizopus microsporus var. microsporus]|uniref:Mitochondrial carrier n=2 Tax=Rhizopus microsporus TaxID=58291 RepID=A0A1X0QNT5_RHIZD|nr:mitochondrial carrier [Rhizopus microsporus var. microsporus]